LNRKTKQNLVKGEKDRMKKFFALVISLAMMLVLVLAAPASAAVQDVADGTLIMDGGADGTHTPVGTIDVNADDVTGVVDVTLTIVPTEGWEYLCSHVYVDLVAPKKHTPGKFPYALNADDGNPVTVSYQAAVGDTVYIAAHVELGAVDELGDPVYDELTGERITESAWAQVGEGDVLFRTNGKGSSWASYFSIVVPSPIVP